MKTKNSTRLLSASKLFAITVLIVALTIGITTLGTSIVKTKSKIPKAAQIHVEMGVPTDNDGSDDYIIARSQYVLSYSSAKNVCNWVSWELNDDWYGDAERMTGSFITDNSLPDDFYHVKHKDYTNSGYDRGHMVRSEERTSSAEDNRATFIITNILPQRPDLNQGVWLNFEYWCQSMCQDSSTELFVMAGGIFKSGKRYGKVSIPDSCFKIVVVLKQGQRLADVNKNTRIEAVIMPNKQGIRKDKWQKYKRTVDDIETATGYDFLTKVPKSVQDAIEGRL